MPTIQSAGKLATVENRNPYAWGSSVGSSLSLYPYQRASYAAIVRTQPNVRTVISFIARNLAQLGVHLFERLSETNRERVRSHPFAETLRQPNPLDRHLTTYRLIHRTVWDTAAYDVAFWAVLPMGTAGRSVIIPLRPDRVRVLGTLWPTGFEYHAANGIWEIPRENVVYFQASHDLENPVVGTSPIETLRRIIAEDEAAGHQREQFWRSGARVSGVIERPVDAPRWTDDARKRFKADWKGLYTAAGPAAGGTPILEDGMTFKEAGTGGDARSAQYVETRKLSREEAAAAYHVDPIWVGIAGAGLSFSSVVERHKALYQDTLGPWVVMLEQDLTNQALPLFEADEDRLPDLYVKLNIAEKLRGSIEDMADALTKLTGRPIFEVNEARALVDRNDIDGGEGLAVPLNLAIAGGTGPDPEDTDELETDPPQLEASARRALSRGRKAVGLTEAEHDALKAAHVAEHRQILERTFSRQAADVLPAIGAASAPAVSDIWDGARWNAELEADLLGAGIDLVAAYAPAVAAALDFDVDELDTDRMLPWLLASSRIAAENINITTRDALAEALDDDDDPAEAARTLFANAESARADTAAVSRFTAVAAFAAQDTATQAGRRSKVWVVTSSNSRHPGLDGETVPLGEAFSNGLQYPGDPTGSADETARCTCLLDFD